jgi:hypothetical protein
MFLAVGESPKSVNNFVVELGDIVYNVYNDFYSCRGFKFFYRT